LATNSQISACSPPPPPPPPPPTTTPHTQKKKGGVPKGGGGGSNHLEVLGLMRFIDCSDGLRQAFGTQVFRKTCTLMACDMPLLSSSPSLGEVLHENQSNLHFDPQLLCSWVVMNIINDIARGGSSYTLIPPSLVCAECTQTFTVEERIRGLKGFNLNFNLTLQ